MLLKYLLKQVNPWNSYTRLFLFLVLPLAIYQKNVILSLILVGLSMLISLIFPILSKNFIQKEYFYHVMRGMFLEYKMQHTFLSRIWIFLLGTFWSKVCIILVSIAIFVYSIVLLWNGNLLVGGSLYYLLICLKLIILSEYAKISLHLLENNEWDGAVVELIKE